MNAVTDFVVSNAMLGMPNQLGSAGRSATVRERPVLVWHMDSVTGRPQARWTMGKGIPSFPQTMSWLNR